MPHPRNVEALAELLYRAEHWDLSVAPPFDRLTRARQDEYRRKAQFLSSRGVVVPSAVAAELEAALAGQAERGPATPVHETLEGIARAEVA